MVNDKLAGESSEKSCKEDRGQITMVSPSKILGTPQSLSKDQPIAGKLITFGSSLIAVSFMSHVSVLHP